jgi:hypothetical protein
MAINWWGRSGDLPQMGHAVLMGIFWLWGAFGLIEPSYIEQPNRHCGLIKPTTMDRRNATVRAWRFVA